MLIAQSKLVPMCRSCEGSLTLFSELRLVTAGEIAGLKEQRGNVQDAIRVLKQSVNDLSESENVSNDFVQQLAKAQKELDVIDAKIASVQKDKMSVEEADKLMYSSCLEY